MFRLLSAISIAILTTLIAVPSQSDDITINLDPTTPYVDVPVTVTEPVDATIQTNTGTPDADFIDSWIELWQDTTRLAFNDDGAHSASNVLASIINIPLLAGEYFIRATSYAYICCNALPTGSYLLSTNLIVVSPTPTLTSSPTESVLPEQPSPEPENPSPSATPTPSSSETDVVVTPQPSSPSPSPTDIPYPTSYPEVQEPPAQVPSLPSPVASPTFSEPEPSPLPSVQDTLEVIVDSSPSASPSFDSSIAFPNNEFQLSLGYLQISLPPHLSQAVQQVSVAISNSLETISNLGSDLTPEEREQAQQVVLGAIIVTQIASIRRIK